MGSMIERASEEKAAANLEDVDSSSSSSSDESEEA